MQSKGKIIFMWVLAALPLLAYALLYSRLPAQVPLQWGFNGAVRYGAKAELLLMALLSLLLAPLFQLSPKLDPRRKNYRRFGKYYDDFCVAMTVFLCAVNGMVYSETFAPGRLNIQRLVCCLVGVLFTFIGNFLPKVKSNFFMGIKTPWTISDPDVWNRTHRLAGRLFFLDGFAIIAAGLALPERPAFAVMLAATLCVAFVPMLMSYVWYRAKTRGADGEEN